MKAIFFLLFTGVALADLDGVEKNPKQTVSYNNFKIICLDWKKNVMVFHAG